MSSIFQHFCDVTESMDFMSAGIHLNNTFQSVVDKPTPHNRLKCFNCFGLPDKQQYCCHCGGSEFVTDQHPLALLFNDVFQRKLGKTAHTKDAVRTEYQIVDPIKEEEEEFDQRKIICDLCNKECGNNYMYICQCCECFYVCVKCAKQKEQKHEDIDHEHPFAKNKNLSNPLFLLKKTSSSHYESDKKHEVNSSKRDYSRRNKVDQKEKFTGQYFNVSDIIDKQISQTYGNVVQNISCGESESLGETDFGVAESLQGYSFKLSELQGSDKGVKVNRQNFEIIEILTRSVIPLTSNSYFLQNRTIPAIQSIDLNINDQDSPRRSIEGRESFGFDYGTYVQEHCTSCGVELTDVYSICRTCQKNDIDFKICSQCDDKKSYSHEKNHKLEMMLGNLGLGGKSQMQSKINIDSDRDEDQETACYTEIPKQVKKRSSLQKCPPRLQQSPFEEPLSGQKFFSKLKSSGSLDINLDFQQQQQQKKTFERESIINLDCDGLYQSVDFDLSQNLERTKLVQKKSSLYEVNNSMENIPQPSQVTHGKNKPKVAFAEIGSDEDNLHFQYVQSEQEDECCYGLNVKNYDKVTMKSSQSSHNGFKSVKSMIISKHEMNSTVSGSHEFHKSQQIKYSQSSIKFSRKQFGSQYQCGMVDENTQNKQKLEYIFHGYCCDQCGVCPIKNVRYHCEECEDFDVCQSCYGVEMKSRHNHRFEKIDGLKKLLDKKNMMLQKKDLNKVKDSVLRSSNIGMLASSKKTVELIKKSVQHLGSTFSSFQKSNNNSYGDDFFSQKFSFKTRFQC